MSRASKGAAACCLWFAACLAFAAEAPALRAGDSLQQALAGLNASGERVIYSSALVRPDMRLLTQPTSTDLESLLREILSPWNLRAMRTPQGDWLITTSVSKPASISAIEESDIQAVDVTASRLRLAVPGASETFLDRQDIERMPNLADDALRMLKVLPGVTGGDYTAALNVRGGKREEALFTIDGAEIHNAFHFRDIDGAMSVLDTHLVDGIDFTTGGMTADVGDYMSGVVGLTTRRPRADDEYRSGVGISFVSAYARTSNTFADERGSWMVSARRGFLDVLTERVVPADEQMTPRYTDVFAATDFDIGDRTRIGARTLLSQDDLRFVTTSDSDDIDSDGKGRSAHLWFTLDHDFSDTLQSRTLLSGATLAQKRNSRGSDEERAGVVTADNDFRFLDLRQDWSWEPGRRHLARWGFNLSDQRGDYDYALDSQIFDPLFTPVPIDNGHATEMSVQLRKLGVYAAWRMQVTEAITGELGGRWDRYAFDPGQEFDVVSPRVNLVYAHDANWQLRAAWGVAHQAQAVNELQVEDNLTQFFEPERVEYVVLGYSQDLPYALSLRVDAYDKQYSHLRPRFENAFDPVALIPEGSVDRVRIDATEARARGVEITLRRDTERGFSGWMSLAFALAEDLGSDGYFARKWEQRQSLSFGTSWTGVSWDFSLAGLIHDGTPTTFVGIESGQMVVGPYNGERFGRYTRLDLRARRDVQVERGKLAFYVEITNLLNRENECCIEDFELGSSSAGAPVLEMEKGYWLPLLPSFGIQWEF